MQTVVLEGRYGQAEYCYDPALVLPPDMITASFADSTAPNVYPDQRVLDLGAGGGIYAARLLLQVRELSNAIIRLVDVDDTALAIAEDNMRRVIAARGLTRNQVRLELTQANWIDEELAEGNTYHHVYFNPPYLPDGEAVHGEAIHSPDRAMYAGPTGWEAYAEVFPNIHRIMAPRGTLRVREPYTSTLAMNRRTQQLEPTPETHSPIIRLFIECSAGRAFPMPFFYIFRDETGRVVNAAGGFVAQYSAPQTSSAL